MSANSTRAWSDERVEIMLGNVLRAGVILSATIITAGGIVYLIRNGTATADYHVFRGEPAELRSVQGILAAALSLRGRGLIQLGILSLIATPIARVVFSVIGFVNQHDWLYVGITAVVLVLLFYGLFGGGV